MSEYLEDLCMCGDYRSDHPDNGPCDLNGLGHGWGIEVDDRCLRFRLASPDKRTERLDEIKRQVGIDNAD